MYNLFCCLPVSTEKPCLVAYAFRFIKIDSVDFQQGEIALALFRWPYGSNHIVTRAQVKATDLARGNIDIVGARKIGAVCRTQEAKAILQDLQNAIATNFFTAARMALQQGKNHVLLAGARGIFYPHALSHFDQFSNGFFLEIRQAHRRASRPLHWRITLYRGELLKGLVVNKVRLLCMVAALVVMMVVAVLVAAIMGVLFIGVAVAATRSILV